MPTTTTTTPDLKTADRRRRRPKTQPPPCCRMMAAQRGRRVGRAAHPILPRRPSWPCPKPRPGGGWAAPYPRRGVPCGEGRGWVGWRRGMATGRGGAACQRWRGRTRGSGRVRCGRASSQRTAGGAPPRLARVTPMGWGGTGGLRRVWRRCNDWCVRGVWKRLGRVCGVRAGFGQGEGGGRGGRIRRWSCRSRSQQCSCGFLSPCGVSTCEYLGRGLHL